MRVSGEKSEFGGSFSGTHREPNVSLRELSSVENNPKDTEVGGENTNKRLFLAFLEMSLSHVYITIIGQVISVDVLEVLRLKRAIGWLAHTQLHGCHHLGCHSFLVIPDHLCDVFLMVLFSPHDVPILA